MADRGPDLQFDQTVGPQAQGPAGAPTGRGPARQRDELGFGGPLEAALLRPFRRLACQGGGQSLFHKTLPHPRHGGHGNLDGRRDVRIQQAPFRARFIGFEENARRGLPEGGRLFLAQQGLEWLSFWRREADAIFD